MSYMVQLSQKADIIEEIARIHGYDNIEPKTNLWAITPVAKDPTRELEYAAKELLASKYGMNEVHSYVWYNTEMNQELGIKVKDFWDFIEANQMLDKLYHFAKQYQKMSPQEQVIYLSEAEKIFTAFDKVPVELWDEEYEKYKQVLKKYNDIKMFRWASN